MKNLISKLQEIWKDVDEPFLIEKISQFRLKI